MVVLEWFVAYRIYFFLKSDAYTLITECFNEWLFAGIGQHMRHEMDSDSWLWRCQLIPALVFLLSFRWLPPSFPEKNSASGMPSSSEKVGKWKYWELLKAWGSCHAWALGNLSLHSSRVMSWSETTPAPFQRWVSWPDLHLHAAALCAGARQVTHVSASFLLTNQDCCG